jgi:hypothetical protein
LIRRRLRFECGRAHPDGLLNVFPESYHEPYYRSYPVVHVRFQLNSTNRIVDCN